MMGIRIVCWHRRVVRIVGVEEVIFGIAVITRTRRLYKGIHRRSGVVIVERNFRKSWLWKGFSDEFTLLVLKMGEISIGFFLGKRFTFLLLPLHDITDALVDLVTAIFLQVTTDVQ